jgi:undecaprenyl-diphosphatase
MMSPHAMLEFIATRDYRLMRRVNRWSAPRWVRLWMICATRGGDGWLWYALLGALLLSGESHRYAAVAASMLSAGIGIGAFLSLKRIAGRKRPCHIEPHCWAKLLPPDQFSFPSGHTITAFAVATPLALFYPALLIGVLFCAFSIATSRIMLGMHFLSDVVAGAAIGGSIGYSAFLLLH